MKDWHQTTMCWQMFLRKACIHGQPLDPLKKAEPSGYPFGVCTLATLLWCLSTGEGDWPQITGKRPICTCSALGTASLWLLLMSMQDIAKNWSYTSILSQMHKSSLANDYHPPSLSGKAQLDVGIIHAACPTYNISAFMQQSGIWL